MGRKRTRCGGVQGSSAWKNTAFSSYLPPPLHFKCSYQLRILTLVQPDVPDDDGDNGQHLYEVSPAHTSAPSIRQCPSMTSLSSHTELLTLMATPPAHTGKASCEKEVSRGALAQTSAYLTPNPPLCSPVSETTESPQETYNRSPRAVGHNIIRIEI